MDDERLQVLRQVFPYGVAEHILELSDLEGRRDVWREQLQNMKEYMEWSIRSTADNIHRDTLVLEKENDRYHSCDRCRDGAITRRLASCDRWIESTLRMINDDTAFENRRTLSDMWNDSLVFRAFVVGLYMPFRRR